MCFEIRSTRKPRPKKARKDIPVWKVIAGSGYSPMYHMRDRDYELMTWEKGHHYTEKPAFKDTEMNKFGDDGWHISGSVLHSKATLQEAEDLASGFLYVTMVVAEMYIPKGALYMENEEEYVSSELIYDSLPGHKLNNS